MAVTVQRISQTKTGKSGILPDSLATVHKIADELSLSVDSLETIIHEHLKLRKIYHCPTGPKQLNSA